MSRNFSPFSRATDEAYESDRRVLIITRDTYLKLRIQQSSDLSSNEKYFVSSGTAFELESYTYGNPIQGDLNGHLEVTLKEKTIEGFQTWFVYGPHIRIEDSGKVVYPEEDQESIPILWVTTDTLFKRRPLQSSALPSEELVTVPRKTKLYLHSYAYADSQGGFDAHIKIAIRYQQDFLKGFSIWFVYDRHGYVDFDGEVVYPPEDPDIQVLRIIRDTFFKRRPIQSSELPESEKYAVVQGSTWKLDSYAYRDANGNDFSGHIKFTLKYPKDEIYGFNTWYVYEPHSQVEIQGKVVYPPQNTPPPSIPPSYSGIPFNLPGNVSTFYTDQPIIPGGNFTWGEATKEATRIPPTIEIVDAIVALAVQLQKARDQLGQPFQVNSWYRPPAINAAVGGASGSFHLTGKAADIEVRGYSGRRVANAVFGWWPGGIGIYSNLPNVIHLDIGPRRTWGI